MAVSADGKAIRAVVAFPPPPIQNAQVQAAMAARFLSAGARGFERPPWVVQPYVAARHHLARDVHIIILDEYDIALELTELAQVYDMLDELFPLVIARMRFAGIDKLNRPLTVVDE